MFDLERITTEESTYLSCRAVCKSPEAAEKIRASFIGPVRQISMFSDLYCMGKALILEAPDRETLLKTADILNHSVPWDGPF